MTHYVRARGLGWAMPTAVAAVLGAAHVANWLESKPAFEHPDRIPAIVLGALTAAILVAPGHHRTDDEVEGSVPRPTRGAELALTAALVVAVAVVAILVVPLHPAERGGLDWASAWQVVESSAAASPIVKAKAPALRAHDYTPTFTVEQMRKDVSLIRAAAAALGVATPVADVAGAALDRASAAGEGGDDYAVVIRDARRQLSSE